MNLLLQNIWYTMRKNILQFIYLNKKIKNVCNYKIIQFLTQKNIYFFVLKKKYLFLNINIFFNLNLYYFDFLNYFFKKIIFLFNNFFNNKFSICEINLKGINYWLCQKKLSILLDLGLSHFYLYKYSTNIYIWLKKKWMKWLVFMTFNKSIYSLIITFFWFTLRPVGPYKLKGFHFLHEKVLLKEGKKPFK